MKLCISGGKLGVAHLAGERESPLRAVGFEAFRGGSYDLNGAPLLTGGVKECTEDGSPEDDGETQQGCRRDGPEMVRTSV